MLRHWDAVAMSKQRSKPNYHRRVLRLPDLDHCKVAVLNSCGKQIASYLGLVPLEDSSGNRRRLGHITKQGNSILRFLLVEAAQVTVRSLPEWRSKYVHLMMRRGRKIAKVAMARRLAVVLYWMWRKGWNYEQSKSSVRTRASSDQAMVCSKTPSN
jgi:transposase